MSEDVPSKVRILHIQAQEQILALRCSLLVAPFLLV